MQDREALLNLWYEALKSDVGLVLSTNDRSLLQQQLYRVRAEAGDDKLHGVVILLPQAENELWLARKDADGTPPDRRRSDGVSLTEIVRRRSKLPPEISRLDRDDQGDNSSGSR